MSFILTAVLGAVDKPCNGPVEIAVGFDELWKLSLALIEPGANLGLYVLRGTGGHYRLEDFAISICRPDLKLFLQLDVTSRVKCEPAGILSDVVARSLGKISEGCKKHL